MMPGSPFIHSTSADTMFLDKVAIKFHSSLQVHKLRLKIKINLIIIQRQPMCLQERFIVCKIAPITISMGRIQ